MIKAHPVLDEKLFELLYDGTPDMVTQTNKLRGHHGLSHSMGVALLRRWHAGIQSGEATKLMRGVDLRKFFERDRGRHFPRCVRPEIIRMFQNYMCLFPELELVRRVR